MALAISADLKRRSRRRSLVAWLSCCMLLPPVALAAGYPQHMVKIIIPASAGTTGDLIARLMAPKLAQRWGVPVVVDNKVGAGGSIGMDFVAKELPDGHTLLMSITAFSTLAAVRSNLPYDPATAFAPVALVGKSPLALIVSNDVPAASVGEFLGYLRKLPPGKFNYASPGVGSVHHLTMELFQQENGVKMTHVPYRATSSVLNDLAAGQVQASFVVLQTAASLVRSGKMRMLAVVADDRVPQFPNVPTLSELGMKKMVLETWVGVHAPAGTPPAIIDKVNADVNDLLRLPDVQAAFDQMGVASVGGSPAILNDWVRREIATWRDVAARAGLTLD